MSDESGAIGALATAGLIAHAATPSAGHAGPARSSCANCSTPVDARFCPNCGQAAHVHRSLLHVGEEILHGITHFDGKAWQTLPLLLFRPGRLTRDYVHGHRARYIPPVAMFLLTVFLMFFAFSFVPTPDDLLQVPSGPVSAADLAEARVAVAEMQRDIAAKRAALAVAGSAPARQDLQTDLAVLEPTLRLAQTRVRQLEGKSDVPVSVTGWARDLSAAEARGDFKLHSEIPGVTAKLRQALANPELTLYKLQQKAYKFSFLLVPLSIPWLWLMFVLRRDVRLYDHAVFTLYSLSFMSLLLIAAVAIGQFDFGLRGAMVTAFMIAIPLHIFGQLRGAYQLTAWGAVWRTGFLLFGALLSLVFFATSIFLLGVID